MDNENELQNSPKTDEVDTQEVDTKDTEEEFELDENLDELLGENEETEPKGEEFKVEDPEVLKEKNKQLFIRAKKAEAEAKALKAKLKTSTLQTNSANEPNKAISLDEVDKRIFLANGGDKEDLEILETIKKGKGISLAEAMQDKLYKVYLEKKEADKKRQEAQLSASKKSSTKKTKKLSPEEEKKEIMEAAKKVLEKNFG